jgi:uncharacterized protein
MRNDYGNQSEICKIIILENLNNSSTERILGFDLARAYAIFGMYIVNFTFCFGSFSNEKTSNWITSLFVGNSTSIFIICAGIGLVLLSKNRNKSVIEKSEIKSKILKRSWFLFGLGLLLYNWWPGDILHFYGGYLHIAAFILFLDKKYYLWIAFFAILIYNIAQLFIPFTTGWELPLFKYPDFWTPIGFIRNTFFNGWNSIFPWFAYFSIGMYLGKLDWNDSKIRKNIFIIGALLILIFKGLRIFIRYDFNGPRQDFYEKYWIYIMEDYFPANIPYIMITTGFALVVISTCIYLGDKFQTKKIIEILVKTGQMTLTHYVTHMTIGVLLLGSITQKTYTGFPILENPISQNLILIYALLFFILSMIFSYFWSKKFKKGPIESLMRKISG